MQLHRDALKQMVLEQQLLSGYADLDGQLTANGFDCRLAAVIEVLDGGKLAVQKQHNRNPKLGKAMVLKGYEHRLKEYAAERVEVVESGSIKLDPLKPYLVMTCEELNTPDNLMTHITARSSLFRITQSLLGCSFGEAGYKGFLTFMLLPFSASEIELGARFAQLSFSELKGKADYAAQKETNYQGGKLF
jgi:deoxycytidine triphosphate deaminase